MEYRILGKTDLRVSCIGMGCVTFGREIDRSASFEILDHALQRGIILLDTAEAYAEGESERVLGDWLESRNARDQVVLATKVHGTLTRQRVVESAEESLQRLKTDHLDLYQLHCWDDATPLDETLGALDSLVQSGKVRYIGCSNWKAWHLAKSLLLSRELNIRCLDSVQPPYNLVQREIEDELLPFCADQQIGVITYSPLGAGFLTGKYRRDRDVPTGSRFDIIPGHQPIYFTTHGFAVLDWLDQLARKESRSSAQLALAWILAQPDVTSVLIGARNTTQVDQAFEAGETVLERELQQQLADGP